MQTEITSRHREKISCIADRGAEANPKQVVINWDKSVSSTRIGQTLIFALVNCLARMGETVSGIAIKGPADDSLMERVNPWGGSNFKESLISVVEAIDVVPLIDKADTNCISVSALNKAPDNYASDYYLMCERWIGGVSNIFTPFNGDGSLPFAAYASAFIVASEIFKDIRTNGKKPPFNSCFYSTWSFRSSTDQYELENPLQDSYQGYSCYELGGVGAVGMAFASLLWSIPTLNIDWHAIDGDPEGISPSNLNRYWLSDKDSIGSEKASWMKKMLGDTNFNVIPIQGDTGKTPPLNPTKSFGVCALDSNIARIAYMKRYLPRMIRGSTFELRAEVAIAGAPGEGACLACDLVPEPLFSEADEILRFKKSSPAQQKAWCGDLGISVEEAHEIVDSTACSSIKEDLLDSVKKSRPSSHEWSVAFVSGMCSLIMAAVAYREAIGNPVKDNKITFQFVRPVAKSNAPAFWPRSHDCSSCEPGSIEESVWKKRYNDY